jgi:hypothetical protein
MSDDPWLWGDGSDLLWGDGESMGELSSLSGGTTWNPDDKHANVALSNGNLTAAATTSGVFIWARSTTSKDAGKVYFECAVDAYEQNVNYAAAGIATALSNLNNYLGASGDEAAYYADGSVYANGLPSPVATLAAYSPGDVIGCAVDVDAGKGWFSKNGVFASGDPASGAGAHFTFTAATALFAGFTLFDASLPDALTANFGATAFAHAVPSGFLGWDEDAAVEESAAPTLTYGAGRLDPRRVRAKYEEIEAIERHIQAKEEAEREKVRKQEEAKRQLAELEDKKRQTKTIAERRRKLEARIAAYQSEITDLRETMIALMEEIERARAAFELQQTIADRRRRMLLLIAAAA